MPIINQGTCSCKFCKEKFEWVDYKQETFTLARGKANFEYLPTQPRVKEYITANNILIYLVRCPNCLRENEFPTPNVNIEN